jgi:hypothetical protein
MVSVPENEQGDTGETDPDDEVTDSGRDSCAELDTLPPGLFFRRFESRVKEGSLWLNVRKRIWFEEAKRRIWPYLKEHGLKIKSSAVGLKDGKAGIWITFLREDLKKLPLSFMHFEEGQKGPVVHAWASIRELGHVFKKRHEDKEIDTAMQDISEEMHDIAEKVRSAGITDETNKRMGAVGKRIKTIVNMVKRG